MSQVSEPKALKVLTTPASDKYNIVNEADSTYIVVPQTVQKAIAKIQDLPDGNNHVVVDVLATAINMRRLEGVSRPLESWNSSDFKSHAFPQTKPNLAFSKLLRTTFNRLGSGITEAERDSLIYFFAKCPHGYDVSQLIRPHSELLPVIT